MASVRKRSEPKTQKGLKIPRHPKTGCLLSYVGHGAWDDQARRYVNPLWQDPTPFHAVLRYDHVERRRSRATVYWKDVVSGSVYHMFLTEFDKVMEKAAFQEVRGAVIDGLFGFRKQGDNYSIRLITEDEVGEQTQ